MAKKKQAYFNHLPPISIAKDDAYYCSEAGDMASRVQDLRKMRYIKNQLKGLSIKAVRQELDDSGFDDVFARTDSDCLDCVLWHACCLIRAEDHYRTRERK